MKKAVIDRIVDDKHAVLLIGESETEEIVKVGELPDGAGEGIWLKLHDDGTMEIDHQYTEKGQSRIQNKMKLLKKKSASKFKK